MTWEKANGKPRLLICDGYESHVTLEFIIHCMFHNIVLLILPSHSSHITQPLDLGIFSPLKQHMATELHGIVSSEVACLQKVEWVSVYARAQKKALCEENIISAYSTAGLFPFYPDKVLGWLPSMPELNCCTPVKLPNQRHLLSNIHSLPVPPLIWMCSVLSMNTSRIVLPLIRQFPRKNVSISISWLDYRKSFLLGITSVRKRMLLSVALSMHGKMEWEVRERDS